MRREFHCNMAIFESNIDIFYKSLFNQIEPDLRSVISRTSRHCSRCL